MTRIDVAVRAAVALALAAAAYFLVHRIFIAPGEARRQHAEDVVQAELAEGMSEASKESIREVVRIERERTVVDRTTVENDREIKQAEGASVSVPEVKSALDRALCMRRVYQREPDCAAMLGAGGGVEAHGADAGGDPTAG